MKITENGKIVILNEKEFGDALYKLGGTFVRKSSPNELLVDFEDKQKCGNEAFLALFAEHLKVPKFTDWEVIFKQNINGTHTFNVVFVCRDIFMKEKNV